MTSQESDPREMDGEMDDAVDDEIEAFINRAHDLRQTLRKERWTFFYALGEIRKATESLHKAQENRRRARAAFLQQHQLASDTSDRLLRGSSMSSSAATATQSHPHTPVIDLTSDEKLPKKRTHDMLEQGNLESYTFCALPPITFWF